MKVSEAMTRQVKLSNPEQTICEAARIMAEIDAGVLPVAEGDRLVGMITDRDIAVRAVAREMPPSTRVREVMSKEVLYCFEDQELDEVARNMGEVKVRRLPVMTRDKRLVGIVSLGDLAHGDREEAGAAVSEISEPGGAHSQKAPQGRSAGRP